MYMEELIAVCGIDCGSCIIRRAPHDTEAAEHVVSWFKKEGWLKEDEGITEVIERKMYCKGCRNDPSVHWSPDCKILKCCTDKGYTFCYECSDFPCVLLTERAKENSHYNESLNRLKKMKERQ
jgi:hypothetical protein